MRIILRGIISLLIVGHSMSAQNRIGTGGASELYSANCMSCHGAELEGGLGGSLLDPASWKQVGKTTSFLEYVKLGNLELGMPAFQDGLSDAKIRSLEIYLAEKRQILEREGDKPEASVDGVYRTKLENFSIEVVIDKLDVPWSLSFLPSGGFIVTERSGSLRFFDKGILGEPVQGIPEIWQKGQGGLMEVALHPDFRKNGWIYLAFSASLDGKSGSVKVVRGRVLDNEWTDEENIFETPQKFHRKAGTHFGTRIVFKDGYLFFSIGDRGAKKMAQDLSVPNGKIHRVFDDGRVPEDNPFVNHPDAFPTIWSYGHRNPQGLDLNPVDGELWEAEHGPRGGDEVNIIYPGLNYGWPTITYGMNYNGTPITEKTAEEGMEQPKHYWTPSIAVCGIDFYEGDLFPNWSGNLFAGGLASKELHRLVIADGTVLDREIILSGIGRVRDVASGPDGSIYLVLNGPNKVVKLVPSDL